MNQKVQELRSQIALLDLQITDLQSLQNIVKTKWQEAEVLAATKYQKIKQITEDKLNDTPANHPKRKLIAEKLTAMQTLAEQRIAVIKDEYKSYQDQIDTLNEQSAALTKNMLKIVE